MRAPIKVAIFTEGQTEQLFVCEAIRQLAGNQNYYVTNVRKNGSGDRLILIDTGKIGNPATHDVYFQICDCGSDSQVLSTLREEYETLVGAGFSHIIGIRDLYPIPPDNKDKFFNSVQKFLPTGTVAPLFVVALLEVEAWFIAENTHFARINPALSADTISLMANLDITQDSENHEHPFTTMVQIYALCNELYEKSRGSVGRTIAALDFNEYLGAAGNRAQSLRPLITRLQEIFN